MAVRGDGSPTTAPLGRAYNPHDSGTEEPPVSDGTPRQDSIWVRLQGKSQGPTAANVPLAAELIRAPQLVRLKQQQPSNKHHLGQNKVQRQIRPSILSLEPRQAKEKHSPHVAQVRERLSPRQRRPDPQKPGLDPPPARQQKQARDRLSGIRNRRCGRHYAPPPPPLLQSLSGASPGRKRDGT